jgi:hypothetical protein
MTMITNSSSVPLIKAIETKEEDDVTVRAVNDRLSLEKKRVFYMDFRAVNEISQGSAFRGSSRVDLQACKLGTGRRFTTS